MKFNSLEKRIVFIVLLVFSAMMNAFSQNDKMVLVGGTDFEPMDLYDSLDYLRPDQIKMKGFLGGEVSIYDYAIYNPSSLYEITFNKVPVDSFISIDTTYTRVFMDTTYVAEYIYGDSMEIIGVDTIPYVTEKDSVVHETITSYIIGYNTIEKIYPTLMYPLRYSTCNGVVCNFNYVITDNPFKADSLDYIYDDKNEWGVIWGRFVGQSKTILRYKVDGLTPNSAVKLVIKYRSVLSPESDIASENDTLAPKTIPFKVDINSNSLNSSLGIAVPEIKTGEGGLFVYDKAYVDSIGAFSFNVNVPGQQEWSSFEITSIEVYNAFTPVVISSEESFTCDGDSVIVKLNQKCSRNVACQWYNDTIAISGATGRSYTFEALMSQSYNLNLELICDSDIINTNVITVNPIHCGDFRITKKIIFKEDFGEIDLTDSMGCTYKVWDYSDINNPVQITKKTKTPFRYELENNPLGYEYRGAGPVDDGEYTVAGVLTGYYSYRGFKGANLEWAGALHGLYDYEMAFDHSGKPEGCCMFINFVEDSKGHAFYEREINNLPKNSAVSFECYISIYTYSGGYSPVGVTLRVSEIGNPSNFIERSATQTTPDEGGTGDWVKISGDFIIEKGNSIKIAAFSNACDNRECNSVGNDLVIDDITVFAKQYKLSNAYFDINSRAKDTVVCDNSDDNIMIYVSHSDLLDKIYGKNLNYLYQWSSTPNADDSWKSIGKPTADTIIKVGETPFVGVKNHETVYFRVVAGYDSILSVMSDSDFVVNSINYSLYSISEPITCEVKCPACTEPSSKIQIAADKNITKEDGKDVINLCYGESVTLSQKYDITPDKSTWENPDFAGYSTKWFVDEKPGDMSDADVVFNGIVTPEKVKYSNKKLGGNETSVVIVAVDALYPDGECVSKDTIFIKYNESPEAELLNPIAEFEEGDGSGNVDLTLTKGTVLDYTIHWWKGQDTLSGISIGDDKSKKFFENLTAENSGIYCYQLVDITTGCAGDVHNYEVKITKENTSNGLYLADEDIVNVYSASGALIKSNVKRSEALCGLENGVYLIGGEKVVVKK